MSLRSAPRSASKTASGISVYIHLHRMQMMQPQPTQHQHKVGPKDTSLHDLRCTHAAVLVRSDVGCHCWSRSVNRRGSRRQG